MPDKLEIPMELEVYVRKECDGRICGVLHRKEIARWVYFADFDDLLRCLDVNARLSCR